MDNNSVKSAVMALEPLYEDVLRCLEALEQDDSQFWRRAYVRSVFAHFEASVTVLRGTAIIASPKKGNEISADAGVSSDGSPLQPHEVDLLHERTYQLTRTGDVETRPYYGRTSARLLFAMKMYAKVVGHSPLPDTSHSGYEAFQTASGIRDRITHPKCYQDTVISEADLEAVGKAVEWFLKTVDSLQQTAKSSLQGRLSSMSIEAARLEAEHGKLREEYAKLRAKVGHS